jgi:ribosomal protein S18 acetylase RimI-like enzyme
MTDQDVPLGMALKGQAGWNQTEADWRRFLMLQPDGCFVAEWNGTPAGTVTTCIFGTTAWVAMVLVDASFRGRGIGTALMHHALAFLDGQRVQRVRLDATPLGRPLYEKLGFVEEYELFRYEGVLPALERSSQSGVSAPSPDEMEDLLRLDREVTGVDRERFLWRFATEFGNEARVACRGGKVVGYALGRPGTRAFQIGPCLASEEAGIWLLNDAHSRHAGENVFLDVPARNAAAVAWVEGRGLKVQRPFVRMCRGPRSGEEVNRLWASSGPEKG